MPKKQRIPRWSRLGDPINTEAAAADIDRYFPDPDAVTAEDVQRYLEYVFPVGLFEESLPNHGYTDVRVTPDRDRVYCYDVTMRRAQGVERAVVRQHLEQAVEQIPESPIAHVQWRVELSVAVITDQQITAQIRVAYLQRVP